MRVTTLHLSHIILAGIRCRVMALMYIYSWLGLDVGLLPSCPARLYMGKPVSETNNKSLAIFHSNIRRLRNKINYISDIIEDLDIVFFTETHLDYLIPNVNIKCSFTLFGN
jgi:hypothetical protein